MHSPSAIIIFGNSAIMKEIDSNSVHLIVTSPPYFNAPFDYPGLFTSYNEFLQMMEACAREMYRVLAEGRIAALVVDDVLIEGVRYPVVADITRIFLSVGFRYRDRIVWVKPEGYIRISRRSGVLLQHPYPMYYYPDNLQESILIFQKGSFNYRDIPKETKEASRIDVEKYQNEKWYLNVWQITNVLPTSNRLEKGVAAFPEEIPYRLITLFTYRGETVLDPFAGSGTTLKVALQLGRNAIGYEIDRELLPVIKAKLGVDQQGLFSAPPWKVSITIREDSRRLRTQLQERVSENLKKAPSNANRSKHNRD